MAAKILTVYGNGGVGKTTFCCKLARYLSRNKAYSLIVSPDSNAPVVPIIRPLDGTEQNKSLGLLYIGDNVSKERLADKIVSVESYPFIGILGLIAGETPLSYEEPQVSSIRNIIRAASELVDYVILDCTSSFNSTFTPAAIEMANSVVRILTPDVRGMSYAAATSPLLKDSRFRYDTHLTMLGMVQSFSPVEAVAHTVGTVSGILPYSIELQNDMVEGEIFRLATLSKKYRKALSVVEGDLNRVAKSE